MKDSILKTDNAAEVRKNSKERKYENSQKEELILALSQSHEQISPPRRHISNNERRKSSYRPESSRQSSESNKNRPTYDYRYEKPRSYNSSR